MTKVCYVSHYPTLSMGGQRSMYGLIEQLDRSKFEPFCIVPSAGELSQKLEQIGCKIIFVPLFAMKLKYLHRLPIELYRLRKVFIENKFDIVHPDSQSDEFMCHLARWGLNAKLVWHIRLTKPKSNDRIHFNIADGVIGVSDGAGRRFAKFNNFDKKYKTIYNGVYTDLFKPANKLQVRKELGLPLEKKIILFAGIYKDGKGIYDLAEAYSIIAKLEPQLAENTLLIYLGHTPDIDKFNKFTEFVDRCNINGNIAIKEPVKNIHQWMQAADLLAIPSHEGIEGMPRVSYEAMSCGVPVVGTNTSGVNESITKETGIIVNEKSPKELALALVKLLKDNEQCRQMGECGRERVLNEFSIVSHARKVEKFYEELLLL